MSTFYSFPGIVQITRSENNKHVEFIPYNDVCLNGFNLPIDRLIRGGCQVEGTLEGGPSGCCNNSCSKMCVLKSEESEDGNVTTYWCDCE